MIECAASPPLVATLTSPPRGKCAAWNLKLLREARHAVEILQRDGVSVMIVKGLALLGQVYRIDERSIADVDLLVPRAHYRRARALLIKWGYRELPMPQRPLTARLTPARVFVSRYGVQIDLHGIPLGERQRWAIDHEGLFRRAVPLALESTRALRPAAEDLLLYVALDQAKDYYATDGRPAQDVRRLIEALPIEWEAVVDRARAWRCTVALWATLRHARLQAGARVPAAVEQQLRPVQWRRRALGKLLSLNNRTPCRLRATNRRIRQLLVGPLVSDHARRFAAAGAYFAALRAADYVVTSVLCLLKIRFLRNHGH